MNTTVRSLTKDLTSNTNEVSSTPTMQRLGSAYRTLDVLPGSNTEEIRKQWKLKSMDNHPDKVGPKNNANVKMALINDAYDVLINELQAREVLPQQQKQKPLQRSFAGSGQQKKPKSENPSQTASNPWPHRSIRKEPPSPASLPSPPPDSTDASPKSLLRKYNTHIVQLMDLQALANSVQDWLRIQSFTVIHPATYAASGHVRSFFRSEILMHNSVFNFLEGLDWRSASRKDSEKQVHWYITTLINSTKNRLQRYIRGWRVS